MTAAWDDEETPLLARRLEREGVRFHAVADELVIDGPRRAMAANREKIRRRRWDLIRLCRGESTWGLRWSEDGRSYTWRKPGEPWPEPRRRQQYADLD